MSGYEQGPQVPGFTPMAAGDPQGSHAAGVPRTTPGERVETSSLGELFGELTRNLSTLIRQEVKLAKAEMKESASTAGKAGGMLGGAGVAGHFTLLFLSLALMWALGSVMHLGWAALVVAVLWGIAAAILASVGRKNLKEVKGLPQTAATVKEIPPTLKPGETTP
ncbi:MAG: phage holin family protein [Arthrobacter sp.]|uniref:phage holin family protein n=1 Tax=Arthrobacter sp. TaxID=1667 RepID=UPI00346C265D